MKNKCDSKEKRDKESIQLDFRSTLTQELGKNNVYLLVYFMYINNV
jgi:hypothetical protein